MKEEKYLLDVEDPNSNIDNQKKLSIVMAIFFIVGEMAGSGILALPA